MSTADERRSARADLEAAKARERALRPWYKKKRFIIPLALVALVVIGAIASGGEEGSSPGGEATSATVLRAHIPGEATLEVGNEKTLTRFTNVTFRREALPGNPFTRARAGKTYMILDAEIQNLGRDDLDLNSTVYRLKLPSGEIVNYTSIGGGEELSVGTTLTPGAKKAGQLVYEVPVPSTGQEYVVLWKPNPFIDRQAQFTYVHT